MTFVRTISSCTVYKHSYQHFDVDNYVEMLITFEFFSSFRTARVEKFRFTPFFGKLKICFLYAERYPENARSFN